jgi:pimeloyl-ACP methyl ester carboxylesterase
LHTQTEIDVALIPILIIFAASLAVVWLVSLGVEALRRAPQTPDTMSWDPSLKAAYITVDGVSLRYVRVGQGPVLLLLHTLRTQLDLFHKVIPELARDFTVYAVDLPGHGYSDVPDGPFDADFFVSYVQGFLEELDLTEATLSGVSIGASISLIIAARHNPRVRRIIPINPYDYDQGRGIARASWVGRVAVALARIPFAGETFMRLRNRRLIQTVLVGGVSDPTSIGPGLLKEMYLVGNRPGHYRGFVRLLRNASSWERARSEYGNIDVPTLMIWGAQDWARPEERRYDESLVPAVRAVTVEPGGHFLPLDALKDVVHLIRSAVSEGT